MIEFSRKSIQEIHQSRLDMSDWLIHFTEKENLVKILKTRKLKSKKKKICFTESPLNCYVDCLKIFNKYSDPLFDSYGIAIRKDILYKKGARPVFYMLPEEKRKLPKNMQWRYVKLDWFDNDYTWQREWRINSKKLSFKKKDIFIVLKEKIDEKEMAFVKHKRIWRSITIDKIEKFSSKNEIDEFIYKQNIPKKKK